MPKEAYELLDVLNVDVASLKANAFTPIGTLSIDNASFSGLDDAGKTQAVVSEFPSWAGNFRNNLAIKTSDNVTYVVSGGTAFDPDWVIWGDVGVTVATNSSLGIVKGTASTPGKIFVESDGSLSLNGFDAIADAIVDLGNNKLNTSAVNSAVFNAQGILADSPPSNTLPGSGITLSIQSILDTMLGNLKALFDGFNNGVANSATKLATARYINLDSTSTTSSALFDGTQDITIGVPVPSLTDAGASSTLPVVGSVVSLRTFSQGVRNNLKELFSYFDSSGSANSAIKLKNGRRLTVNLGSQTSTPATFDGTANVSIGVEGVLKRISGGLENEIGATYFDGVKQFSSSADLAAFLLTIPPNSHYSFLISFSSVILGGVNAPSAGLWLYDFYQQDNTLANSFSELRWAGGSSNVGYIGLCQRLSYSKRGDPTTDAVKWARDIPIRVVPTRVKQWGKLFSQTEYVLTVPNNTNASQPVFVEFDAIINNNTTIGGSANTRVYISSLGRAFQYMTSITTHNIYLGVQGFTGYYIRIAVTHPSDWEYHFIPNAYYFNGSNIDWKTINTPIDMYIGYDKEPFDGTVAD
jgi:hypothetical protein